MIAAMRTLLLVAALALAGCGGTHPPIVGAVPERRLLRLQHEDVCSCNMQGYCKSYAVTYGHNPSSVTVTVVPSAVSPGSSRYWLFVRLSTRSEPRSVRQIRPHTSSSIT